jgi:hypothetical protein
MEGNMNNNIFYKHIISNVYKMLCWREEKKHWTTIYDELLTEISLGNFFSDEDRAALLLKIVPLKFVEFRIFRQKIFEVIDYVERLSGIQE